MKTPIIFLLSIALSETRKPKVEIYEIRENVGDGKMYFDDRYIHNDVPKETGLLKLLKPYKVKKYDNTVDRVTKELIDKLAAIRTDDQDKKAIYVLNDDIIIDDDSFSHEGFIPLSYNNINEDFIDNTRSQKYSAFYDKNNILYRILNQKKNNQPDFVPHFSDTLLRTQFEDRTAAPRNKHRYENDYNK